MDNKIIFVFDLDGVIIETVEELYHAYLNFLREFGFFGTREEFEKLNGPKLSEIISYLKKKYNLSESQENLTEKYLIFIKNAYVNAKLIKNSNELINFLKKEGFKIALATSSKKEQVYNILKKFNIFDHFEFIATGDEVRESKPSPEIYLTVKKHFGEKIYYVIEDSENGIISAKNAGMKTIFFNQNNRQILEKSDYVVKDLLEIKNIVEKNNLENIFENKELITSDKIQINILEDPELNETIERNRGAIEKVWDEKSREKGLFNGKIVSLKRIEKEKDSLSLFVSVHDYKSWIAQKNRINLGIRPVGVSGTIVLKDEKENYFLFGKRSKNLTNYPGFFELVPSGGIDTKYLNKNIIDYKKQLSQELYEETSIPNDFINNIKEFAVTFDKISGIWDVCCIIDIAFNDKKLIEKLSSKEYEEFVIIAEKEISDFILNQRVVPISINIVSWYREKFVKK